MVKPGDERVFARKRAVRDGGGAEEKDGVPTVRHVAPLPAKRTRRHLRDGGRRARAGTCRRHDRHRFGLDALCAAQPASRDRCRRPRRRPADRRCGCRRGSQFRHLRDERLQLWRRRHDGAGRLQGRSGRTPRTPLHAGRRRCRANRHQRGACDQICAIADLFRAALRLWRCDGDQRDIHGGLYQDRILFGGDAAGGCQSWKTDI